MGANFRYMPPGDIVGAVDSAVVVEIGDLVFLNTDDIRPAGQDSDANGTGDLWDTSLAVTQEVFRRSFLGVAVQRSQVGETDPIRVLTDAVIEFDCAAAQFEIGDLVGPAKTSGNNLENQKVAAVASASLAIGRVAKRYASNTTKVLVHVRSLLTEGGVAGVAAAVAALTDGTMTGTANGAMETVGATNGGDVSGAIMNNFKECQTQINAIVAALKAAGLMAAS